LRTSMFIVFFFSSRRRHTRFSRDWSSDVCSSDLGGPALLAERGVEVPEDVDRAVAEWRQRGAAVLYVIENGEVTGAFSVEDEIQIGRASCRERGQVLMESMMFYSHPSV